VNAAGNEVVIRQRYVFTLANLAFCCELLCRGGRGRRCEDGRDVGGEDWEEELGEGLVRSEKGVGM